MRAAAKVFLSALKPRQITSWLVLGILSSQLMGAQDPNVKVGPAGVGPERFISPGEELFYKIFFENPSNASAPVERLVIRDRLHPSLDWTTFRLQEIGFGGEPSHPVLDPGCGTVRCVDTFDVAGQPEIQVQIAVQLDLDTKEVQWLFQTIDPQTGDPPHDPYLGFLPPNDVTHRGEGFVSFSIRLNQDLAEGAEIMNAAEIRFDELSPLVTNLWVNHVTYSLPPQPPGNPLPPDGAQSVPADPILCWAPSARAEAYSLFLWGDALPKPDVPVAAGLANPCFQPPSALNPNTVYDWQVTAENPNGSALGPVWTFTTEPAGQLFLRGDASGDGKMDISDAITILSYLFLGGRQLSCLKSADTNDSGELGIADAIFLLIFLFQGGAVIPPPSPSCGRDSTPDDLSCDSYPGCG